MNGLVGGFLPAWYAMKKDKGFVAFECMLFVLLFALLISLCARAGGRFVALSSKLLSSWELRRAAVDLDCRFEHYFRYEALAVSIKKRELRRCAGAMDPFPVSNDPVLCGALAPIWKGNPLHQRPGRTEAAWHQSAHGASFTDP